MANYGPHFEFRWSPRHGNRAGRYFTPDAVVIGAPVNLTSPLATDATGLRSVSLATGAQAKPKPGSGGILVFEYSPWAFRGDDQNLTTYSDKDFAPAGAAVQVVNGEDVKVAYRNTTQDTFLNRTDYPHPRVMVAGLSLATPTIRVGEYLTPGTGNDTDGYWAETSNADEAWLIVTYVNGDTGEIEARLNF